MGVLYRLSKKTGMPIWQGDRDGQDFEPVKDRPKGTKLISQTPERVEVKFKATVRGWWLLPAGLLVFLVFGALPFGGVLGVTMRSSPFEPFNTGAFFTPVLLTVVLLVLSYLWTFPWVRVVATRDYVQVGPYFFDRARYGGVRTGYEITYSGQTHSGQSLSFVFKGLRLVYGPWGDELPYMVKDYDAVAVTLWLSVMIGSVQNPEAKPATEQGLRTQKFDS